MKMRILEVASYVALFVVCSLGAYRLWQFQPQQTSAAVHSPVTVPTSISGRVPVDLATRKKWIVLVLSTQCRFCLQSIPFHQALLKKVQSSSDLGLVAVFPQARQEVEQYEAAHDFFPKTVTDVVLSQLEIRGTPTLLVVDQHGNVLKHWEGLLPENKQVEVRAEVGTGVQN